MKDAIKYLVYALIIVQTYLMAYGIYSLINGDLFYGLVLTSINFIFMLVDLNTLKNIRK